MLWLFSLWVLWLGTSGVWRAAVLWRERSLLSDLGSSLSPAALTAFALVFALCGVGLVTSALGLWLRTRWAQCGAKVSIVLYAATTQAYSWGFVRSGLMRERRVVSLVVALLTVGVGVGALSWNRSRKWLGLDSGAADVT